MTQSGVGEAGRVKKKTLFYTSQEPEQIKMSYPSSFSCGVPQGSVVDLLLLSIGMGGEQGLLWSKPSLGFILIH